MSEATEAASAHKREPEAINLSAGFAVIYRWRIRADREGDFVAAWSTVTGLLKSGRGSLGARLHRGQDGIWYSYAQWPDREARAAAFARGDVDSAAQAVMREAILEQLPEIALEPVADLLASGNEMPATSGCL